MEADVDDWTKIAKAGYDAYAIATGGRTYDGKQMPLWEELPERIRDAWRAATRAAVLMSYELPG